MLCVTRQMIRKKSKDPVGSAVRYDMMNYEMIPVVTWWYLVSISWYLGVQGLYRVVLNACIY